MGDIAGLSLRPRIDAGTLGVVAIRASSARQAVELIRRGHGHGLTVVTAGEVVVEADVPQIPVGIDGETIHDASPGPLRDPPPGAARDRAQGNGLGCPPPSQPWSGPRLRQLAGFHALPDG